MAIIGYARVSTRDQNLDLQMDALKKAGCTKIFTDFGVSGAKKNRAEWDKCLACLLRGDKLVVYKLDRVGRNLRNLLEIIDILKSRGVEFQAISNNIDTSTPMGNLMFAIMAAFAEYERELIRERILAGMEAAKSRGKAIGRPRSISDSQFETLRHYILVESMDIKNAAKMSKIPLSSAYRLMREISEDVKIDTEED